MKELREEISKCIKFRDFANFCQILKFLDWFFSFSRLFIIFAIRKIKFSRNRLLAHVSHELLQFPSQRLEPKNSMITRFLTF